MGVRRLKISYSRYKAFVDNPERYRLSYGHGLVPEGDEVPTNFNYGRRRGSCVHAILEATAKGKRPSELTGYKYPADLYQRCEKLAAKMPPLQDIVVAEHDFEFPIMDGKHSVTGRIDHIVQTEDGYSVGDFKSTKKRTKKEMSEYLSNLDTSPQSHFYLFAADKLGYTTSNFIYHILVDEKDKPDYFPLPVSVGPAALARTIAEVYAACETITFLTEQYGLDKPWPHSNNWPCAGDKVFCGFASICGRGLPVGCIPDGFTPRTK